jgi:hypothetical protein
MPGAETGLVKARHVFTKHGGMLRAVHAIRLGIHPRTLYALRDAGEIEQITNRWQNAPFSIFIDIRNPSVLRTGQGWPPL